MTETVVHVTTLEQWKSVLDIWFKQGYFWVDGDDIYNEHYFWKYGSHQIGLKDSAKKFICCWVNNDYGGYNMIEYSEFMAQQKEDNKIETYYVTQEQLDLINDMKDKVYPLYKLLNESYRFQNITHGLSGKGEKALLRYLGGDETIEFNPKEQLYRLWRLDDEGDSVYMIFGIYGTPTYTSNEDNAFTATLEKIREWQTPSWEIEEVN